MFRSKFFYFMFLIHAYLSDSFSNFGVNILCRMMPTPRHLSWQNKQLLNQHRLNQKIQKIPNTKISFRRDQVNYLRPKVENFELRIEEKKKEHSVDGIDYFSALIISSSLFYYIIILLLLLLLLLCSINYQFIYRFLHDLLFSSIYHMAQINSTCRQRIVQHNYGISTAASDSYKTASIIGYRFRVDST